MQLPQEHPKHTHDVLRVLPSPGTITAVTSLIFAYVPIKNVSNQSCPSVRDRQLAACNAPQDPGTWLYATPLPDQNQASLLSLWPQPLTDLSLLSPFTYVLKTLFHCYLFPDILPMPTVQRASGVISTTSHWSYRYQAAHKNQHGRLHFDQH